MTAQLDSSRVRRGETLRGDATRRPARCVGTYPVHTAEDVAERVAKGREAQEWWAGLGFAGPQASGCTRGSRWLARDCDDALRHRLPGDRQAEAGRPVRAARRARGPALGGRARQAGAARAAGRARAGDAELRRAGRPTSRSASSASSRRGTRRCTPRSAAWPTRWRRATRSSSSRASSARRPACTPPSRSTRPTRTRPEGLVSWITGFGETGAALCRSGIDKLGFTGSVPDRPAGDGGVRREPHPGAARTRRQGRDRRRRGRRHRERRRVRRLGLDVELRPGLRGRRARLRRAEASATSSCAKVKERAEQVTRRPRASSATSGR